MTFASEVRFSGLAVRDAELAYTPGGVALLVLDLAVREGDRTVYVPVRMEGSMAIEESKQPMMGNQYLVVGYLWRGPKTVREPYPQLVVVAYVFNKIAKVETPRLFEEAMA